jgi:hypothetical protein
MARLARVYCPPEGFVFTAPYAFARQPFFR